MKRKATLKKMIVALLTVAMTLTLNITVFAESLENNESDPVQCKKNATCILEDGHEGDCTTDTTADNDEEIQLMSVDDGYTEWTDSTSLPSRGVYKLTTDVTLAAKVTVGSWASARPEVPTNTLVLDLNGHTITAANGEAFFIQTNGGLTIEDSAGGGEDYQ